MAEPFLGQITMFAGNFAPLGWAFCAGQLLQISENEALYSLLGTTYGGDGVESFALPDLRGRAPVHRGQGPGLSNRTIGEAGGVESATLTSDQLPPHTHTLVARGAPGGSATPQASTPARALVSLYGALPSDANMSASAIGTAGGGQPHDNMQPYLCVNFIIALQGIYPSQS